MTLRAAVRQGLTGGGALVLLTDVDGTLAPIRSRPPAVRLPRRTRRLLARLARHPRARVGVISGRRVEDLRRLVRVPRAALAGCHGLEIVWGRARLRHPGAARMAPVVRRAARELEERTRGLRGVLVEPKGLTVCLHFRLAPPAAARALEPILREVRRRAPALEVLRGKRVLELRPGGSWGKGEAALLLHGLLARSLRRAAPLTLYLGDDETDEEAFRALGERAVCVAVGRRPSRAPYRLRGPAAVADFLAWLAESLGPAGAPR